MGKKKGGFNPRKSKVDSMKSAVEESDDEAIEQHLQSILEDEIDQYNSMKDQALLDKAKKGKGFRQRKGQDDDEEQEVYGLDLTSDEEDGDDDAAKKGFDFEDEEGEDEDMSDLEEDDDDDADILGNRDPDEGLPDSRAWGKKARMYHNTDYVDQDFGGFEGSDAEMAEQEEAEAKEIQKRLTAELDESDFLGLIPVVKKQAEGASKKGDKDKGKEILKVDFDKLTIAEKRKLVERECPEVVHMLDEYKEKLKDARAVKKELVNNVSDNILSRFYQSKFHTLLNYCINISYYLYLRATSPTNCKGHPVIKRILQFRRLLDELSQFDPSKYVPSQDVEMDKPKKEKKKVKAKPKQFFNEFNIEPALGDADQFKFGDESNDEEGEDQEKRGITYAIAKNKGLTPKRKKEQRNPRVKHREKYRKAKIRRKGQVRTARTEVQKYGGELTGIKSHVTKSVKLK